MAACVCVRSFMKSKTGNPRFHKEGEVREVRLHLPRPVSGCAVGLGRLARAVTPLDLRAVRAGLAVIANSAHQRAGERGSSSYFPSPTSRRVGQPSRQPCRGQARHWQVISTSRLSHRGPTVAAKFTISPRYKRPISHLPLETKLVIWGLQSHLWKSRHVPT